MELTHTLPSFTLDSNWPIQTKDRIAQYPQYERQEKANGSIISRDCVVKGIVEDSIISPGVQIEDDVIIRNSIIMDNSVIESRSIIDRSILDEDVHIGRACHIGLGTSLIPGDWDITIIGKGTKVPPETVIARNCKIMPYVRPEDFTSRTVLSGTIICRHGVAQH